MNHRAQRTAPDHPALDHPVLDHPGLDHPMPSSPSTGVRLAWLVPGGLLAAAALVWGTFNVLTVLAHEVRTEQAAFPAAEVDAVEITSTNGSVTLVGADPAQTDDTAETGEITDEISEITVKATIDDGWRASDVEMHVVDGVLRIDGSCPFLGQPWCRTDFDVVLPPGTPVRVDASNGAIEASGIHGAIDLDTDNGHVAVTDVSGAIRITNDNGRIVGRRIGVASLDAETANGRIELSFVEPPDDVHARSNNGRIEVQVPDADVAYRVVLATANGSEHIGVRTDSASLHTIDLASRNGSVSVEPLG